MFCFNVLTIPEDTGGFTCGDSDDSDSNGFVNEDATSELVLKLPVLFRDDKFRFESGEPNPLKFDIWLSPVAASFALSDPRPPGNIAATAAAAAAAAEVVIVAELVVVLFDVYGIFAPSMILLKIFSSKLLLRVGGRYFELAYNVEIIERGV